MKNLIWIIVAILLLGGIWFAVKKPTEIAGSIKIGAALALTGDCADFGQGEKEVTDLLIGKYNETAKRKVDIVYEDTHCDDRGTVSAITKLINIDKVPLIIGPTWGDSYQGGNTIAEKTKVVLITPSAALESVRNKKDITYLFSTWLPLKNEMEKLTGYAKSNGYKKIAVVSDEDPYDTIAADYFRTQAKEQGFSDSDIASYVLPIGSRDFRTVVVQMKSNKPDVIYISLNQIATYGVFLQQMNDLGLKIPVISTSSTQNQPLVDKFGKITDGLTYTFPKEPTGDRYDALVAEYKDKYNKPPLGPTFLSTANAMAIFTKALDSGASTGEDFKKFFQTGKTEGYGIDQVSFDENGQITTANFDIKTIKDGKFVVIGD